MKVKLILLSYIVTLVTCQNNKRRAQPQVQGQGRTLGLIQPILSLGGGLLGGGGGGLFGDTYRPTTTGSVQSDQNGYNPYGGYYGYPGYYGGYPSYASYGGYRPSRRPGLLSLLTGFGGYGGGYGGYPSYASYGGYPSYAGYGSYGSYPSYGNYARPNPSAANSNVSPVAAPINNGAISAGTPSSISPEQAAQLGQSLGTLLRPLLSSNGGSASPDAANSLISLLDLQMHDERIVDSLKPQLPLKEPKCYTKM